MADEARMTKRMLLVVDAIRARTCLVLVRISSPPPLRISVKFQSTTNYPLYLLARIADRMFPALIIVCRLVRA